MPIMSSTRPRLRVEKCWCCLHLARALEETLLSPLSTQESVTLALWQQLWRKCPEQGACVAPLILVSLPRVSRLEWAVGGSSHSRHPSHLSQEEADSAPQGESGLEFHHIFLHSFIFPIFIEPLLGVRQSLWKPPGSLPAWMLNTHYRGGTIKTRPDRTVRPWDIRCQGKSEGRHAQCKASSGIQEDCRAAVRPGGELMSWSSQGSVVIAAGRAGLQWLLHRAAASMPGPTLVPSLPGFREQVQTQNRHFSWQGLPRKRSKCLDPCGLFSEVSKEITGALTSGPCARRFSVGVSFP